MQYAQHSVPSGAGASGGEASAGAGSAGGGGGASAGGAWGAGSGSAGFSSLTTAFLADFLMGAGLAGMVGILYWTARL